MVGAIVHQLTEGASLEELERAGLTPYYTDHGYDIYPQSAAGAGFDANCLACKGDAVADLTEDLAADVATLTVQQNYNKILQLENGVETNRGIILGEKDNKMIRLPDNCFLNKNIAVIGSSGSMKTRAFVKPNILQLAN